MGRIRPILFNTDMVQAILDGRKTTTRRMVKYKYNNTEMKMHTDKYGTCLIEIQKDIEGETHGKHPDGRTWRKVRPYIEKKPPCRKGDILYVRETWEFLPCIECMDEGPACHINPVVYDDGDCESEGCFIYKASHPHPKRVRWAPSIHMPKEAARIWLKVTNVRVEFLQEMTGQDILREGIDCHVHPEADYFEGNQKMMFAELWNSTIKKADLGSYGWDANPWVWVIAFERCEKPEST